MKPIVIKRPRTKRLDVQSANAMSGKYRAMVTERPILAEKRVEFFLQEGDPVVFESAYGHPFSGSTPDYLLLPDDVRQVIDTRLSQHITDNPEMWNPCPHTSKVCYDHGMQRNMILDSGLDLACGTGVQLTWGAISKVFGRCWAGTGTTPTVVDSGAITVTIAAGTATASAPFFTVGMVNQLLVDDTGTQQYITGFISDTIVAVSGANAVAAQLFAVWAVNQTSMVTALKSSELYLAGACGNAASGGAGDRRMRQFRTFDFTAEVANINYSELGWTALSQASTALFSRTLVTGGTVTVLIGQALRVYYEIETTIGPSVSTAGTMVVTGWPVAPSVNTDGNYLVSQIAGAQTLNLVDTNGNPAMGAGFNGILDFRTNLGVITISTSTTLPAWGSSWSPGATFVDGTAGFVAYVAGSFQVVRRTTFAVGVANRTDWRSIGFGQNSVPYPFVFVFNQAQTKDNLHTLQINLRLSWGRIFVNP